MKPFCHSGMGPTGSTGVNLLPSINIWPPHSNDLVGSSWNETTRNISRTVSAIEVLRPLAESGDVAAAGALYEMIALRAFLNMMMLDSWGLVFQKETSGETSVILRREEAGGYLQS